jgi:hypothetical protein
MVKAKAQAFTAGWAKQAILDAVPNDIDFSEADISPNDRVNRPGFPGGSFP